MDNKLLSHRGYEGTCEVSIEDRCLHGRVLHIRDIISYGGDTFDELEASFKESVDGYLAHCEQVGKSPDKPYSGTFNIRIGAEKHRKLVDTGIRMGMGLNETVLFVIDAYFDEQSRVARAFSHDPEAISEFVRRISVSSVALGQQITRISLNHLSATPGPQTHVYRTTATH